MWSIPFNKIQKCQHLQGKKCNQREADGQTKPKTCQHSLRTTPNCKFKILTSTFVKYYASKLGISPSFIICVQLLYKPHLRKWILLNRNGKFLFIYSRTKIYFSYPFSLVSQLKNLIYIIVRKYWFWLSSIIFWFKIQILTYLS